VLLTLSTTMPAATDLGFLLHKHPDRAQPFAVAVGTAHVVWPVATPERSTVALLLEVDPVALVRGKGSHGSAGFSLAQYVNDRPYAASSMLSVALGKVFRTAMTGRCDARPELAARQLPLEVHIPALPSRGGAGMVERLFAPLGWTVAATPIALDPEIPAWGESRYVDVRLSGTLRVADALTQLYVLMPVLDDSKHYWVGAEEVDKLLRAGEGWLADHPERDLITRRYLRHQRELVMSAVGRLAEVDDAEPEQLDNAVPEERPEEPEERPAPLVQLRRGAVLAALRAERASSIVDVGCGTGALLRELIRDPAFTKVLGVEVSHRALEIAARRLRLDRLPDLQRARLELIQSSVTYRDDRLAGHDAIVLMEVVEHIDPQRLPALERTVFGHARPTSVVVTTPNVEHNVRYESLAAGTLRHPDHRFEWTRAQFRGWADATAATYGYTVRYLPIGADDPQVGPPTQMAVFRRAA
jgi:3' terminal RNA ribose 2'-O-methyltransferase Hen1